MSKRAGIILVLLTFIFNLQAQQKWNYVEVDKKSYQLFQQKKWKELIVFNDEARSHGIDYFYLQARTGIAYYNIKKYRKSSTWLLKAWENDQSLEWLQEYLYYSLIYSGRTTEASKVAKDFSPAMKLKIGFANMKPLRVAFEAGLSLNPDLEQLQNSNFEIDAQVGENYGEAFFLKNYHFEAVDFSHQLAPGFNLNHNFTYLGINREEQLFWGTQNNFLININQFQYYLSPQFVLGKKLYVAPSVNIIWGNSDLVLGNIDPGTFYNSSLKYSDYIFSTSLWSHYGNWAPGAEISFANIFDTNFTQASVFATFYPFSNARFYVTPRIYFKNDEEENFAYNTFGISGGFQLGQFHFYGNYLEGEMKNFIESGGYVIANFPGRSTRKFSGSIYFPFAKNYQFVVRYINQDIFEEYLVYTNTIRSNSIEYSYIKHTLTAGISWNF